MYMWSSCIRFHSGKDANGILFPCNEYEFDPSWRFVSPNANISKPLNRSPWKKGYLTYYYMNAFLYLHLQFNFCKLEVAFSCTLHVSEGSGPIEYLGVSENSIVYLHDRA